MIRIQRPPYPLDPETTRKLDGGRDAFMKFMASGARQDRFDFKPQNWGKAKEMLKAIQYGKCAYCESIIGPSSFGSLETFRPKARFPELAYDWNNLLLACQVCNVNKRDKFPLEADGTPSLVDPASEDPSVSIAFDETGHAIPKTSRGDVTITTIALNRPELKKERAKAIQKYLSSGLGSPGDEVAYAGAIRSALESRLGQALTGAKGSLTKKDGKGAGRKTSSTEPLDGGIASASAKREFSYIASIHIKNFRALTDLKINMPLADGKPGWQVLLGENAAGKSTVLKAISMALMGREHLNSIPAYQKGLLRRNKHEDVLYEADSGLVTITFFDGKATVLKFDHSGLRFKGGAAGMAGTIRGYGSMRLLPEEGGPDLNATTANVSNLFHPQKTLVNTEKLLTGFYANDLDKFDKFATHIKKLLRLEDDIGVENGELFVPIGGTPMRVGELSDGYQAMMALAVDLMNSFDDFRTMESAPGILLLDELGTHLHPRWRFEFVERLRSTFEGLQVIATTHEPLCLRGLKKGEVGLLRRDPLGNVEFVKDDDLPDIEGMRVDQILTSPIFGLHSTIDPVVEREFVRYYALLAKPVLSQEEEEQRADLATKLKPNRHLAYTRRDQLMYQAIDLFLAEEANAPRPELTTNMMQKLRAIWNEAGIPGIGGGLP